MPAKRKYKDSVFISLFSDKKRLLELYNAIEGTSVLEIFGTWDMGQGT
ncbi:MAG: hypothetical protein LBH25_12805 [Fibromonadaceae bacterium]|jgi:hypothetical protein|nr:hypothetical protein [Fibromonadaceae bacterium]